MLVKPIDTRKTKKAVEEKFEIYNRYLLSIADNNQLILDEKTYEIKLDINEQKNFG